MTTPKSGGAEKFCVTFWGTRGTRKLTRYSKSGYGADTICVEVQCGNRVIVFDAGSGFVNFGQNLIAEKKHKRFDLFLSHAHYDHVEGIPFFQPFYELDYTCTVWAGKLNGIEETREIFDFLMMEPYFPISIEKFQADLSFRNIQKNEVIDLGDGIIIKSMRLHHPGGATGYRVEYDGKSFGFILDTTHPQDQRDLELVDFLKDIDAFAYDCGYTDEEFPNFVTFGHSTWQEALRLREASGAGCVFAMHHMPFRSDKELAKIDAHFQRTCEDCCVAKDGMKITL